MWFPPTFSTLPILPDAAARLTRLALFRLPSMSNVPVLPDANDASAFAAGTVPPLFTEPDTVP
jgi:hypothetical protein